MDSVTVVLGFGLVHDLGINHVFVTRSGLFASSASLAGLFG